MSEEIFLEGKTYVSSKRAADQTGYAQDYIGQLARKGLVDAQRVGGLWYVTVDSLSNYQRNAASYTPQAPVARILKEVDSVVTFDGKDYVSASRAAKLTGYNQDYIGQLARSGKILSRQIGNRWYVDRDMLLSHKNQKDALLAAVQAESVGLMRPDQTLSPSQNAYTSDEAGPMLTYITESEKDLMPVISNSAVSNPAVSARMESDHRVESHTQVPIRRVNPTHARDASVEGVKAPTIVHERRVRKTGKTMRRAMIAGAALTFVIVLSYGWSDLREYSTYTINIRSVPERISSSALSASAAAAAENIIAAIERWIAPELHYSR